MLGRRRPGCSAAPGGTDATSRIDRRADAQPRAQQELRPMRALIMVIAAYVAEVVRGGLQAVPRGQYEAAASIGLPYWPSTILIVLPQALRLSIPSLVNTFIAFFKDTSLVIIIGLFDLLGAAKAVIVDAKWVGFGVEVYVFVAIVYFAFCFGVSQYSQHLERVLLTDRRY
jgi:general L-amino acid transport system permease protein